MKLYNIKENIRSQEFPFGKLPVVKLGEKGRGRRLELVPVFLKEEDKYGKIGTTRSGKIKVVSDTHSNGWLAVIYTGKSYSRNTTGYIKADKEAIKVLATGQYAFGDAGRIGDGLDYLLQAEDNTLIYVKTSGYNLNYYLFFSEKEVQRIHKEELDIFMDSLEESLYKRISKQIEAFEEL